ncbi:MAG: NAD-dependent epimerase/dehydratase family protein, partial [Candidatus Limnocylindria bacterium]
MRVLVTGANGHLGFNLVTALLATGHAVRGSIRSLADTAKTARLKSLGDVEVVEAELSRPDQLRAAMEGVELLYHTAAVYSYAEPGRNREMLDASIKGTEAAFRAAADAGVRKVVLTSSVVTLPLTDPGAPPVDETRWADDLRVPYLRAKTEGERVAWRTARELGLKLVTVLPGAITGPGFRRNTPSIDLIESMMGGTMRLGVPDLNLPLVDVRDVTAAHLLAGERDVEGRFAVCNDTLPTFRAMLEAMHAIDPKVRLPLMTLPSFMAGALPLFDRVNRLTSGTPVT